jgi:holo-[acyl-carrier protein] synthase
MPGKKTIAAPAGIGIDLVETARIRRLAANPRFLSRVFTGVELAYCGTSLNRFERLAARFAVKEAVIKAFDDKELGLRDIEVENSASGRPQVRVAKYPRASIMVSITHTARYAAAAVFVLNAK